MKTRLHFPLPVLLLAFLLLGAAPSSPAADSSGSVTTEAAAPLSPPREKEKDPPLGIQFMGITVGLVAVVMGCGIPLLAIWTDYRKKHEFLRLCHQERLAALDKGLEPPPFPAEFFSDDDGPSGSPRTTGLKTGLVWLALGVGLAIWLGSQAAPRIHPGFSAIPIALGLAYLLYYQLEGKKFVLNSAAPPP